MNTNTLNPNPSCTPARSVALATALCAFYVLGGTVLAQDADKPATVPGGAAAAPATAAAPANATQDAAAALASETAAIGGAALPPTDAPAKAQPVGSTSVHAAVPITPSCLKPTFPRNSRDYRDRTRAGVDWLNVVEQYHFYPSVRRLTLRPQKLAGELSYILTRIPNHHRALHLVTTLEARDGILAYSGEHVRAPRFAYCYLDNARKFSPDDPTVEMLVGIYYHKRKAHEQALAAYGRAIEMEPAFAEAYYNLGLLHFDRKDYDASSASARKAAELGYPLTALRKKLARGGHWRS